MKIHQFLEHHGIARNPFAEEDAQTDPVFKDHCILSTYHPTWDKVYGDPAEPATSIVFGQKGSGKTAMRLQLARHLEQYNQQRPEARVYVIHYDDFNPFLDRFRDRLHGRHRRADRVLTQWKLWDHMDAILSLGVTALVDRILEVRRPSQAANGQVSHEALANLDRHQARDLLLLAACYDQSMDEPFGQRWHRLRRKLHFSNWLAHWDLALGCAVTLLLLIAGIWVGVASDPAWVLRLWYVFALVLLAGWAPWLWRLAKNFWRARGILGRMRVGIHATGPLCRVLMQFRGGDLSSQPLPNKDSTDDRYELLMKFQGVLEALGFAGIIVLVDRVDEPHLINGSAELMKALVWPMLDNKFLKHPGMGVKLMLPIELTRFVEREERDFYQRARLDKQNMIASFQWSGEALYDVANARIRACALPQSAPTLRDLLVPELTDQRLIESLRSLRVPRHLFKFLYRLIVDHCAAYTDDVPQWRVSTERWEATLALYLRDQDSFDRGLGAG
ncbi:MAG: hypothetical protein J5I93_30185 [Pirellulaceae bacterium]|nr:hypothetical protein [Pirellulaceae bacterium]